MDSVRLKSKSDSELVQENSVKFANFSKMKSSPNSEEGRIINAWNDLKQEAGIINKIKVSVSWVLDFRLWHTKLNWGFFDSFFIGIPLLKEAERALEWREHYILTLST